MYSTVKSNDLYFIIFATIYYRALAFYSASIFPLYFYYPNEMCRLSRIFFLPEILDRHSSSSYRFNDLIYMFVSDSRKAVPPSFLDKTN